MSEIITVCIDAAKEAGDFLQANFGKEIANIETKADQSLATNLDREAERMVVDRIRRSFPNHGIIGEESGDAGVTHEYTWIIDPLDGTHNFIRGISIFGVSIGVAYRGGFVAGAVYLPISNEMYFGEKGNGAYKNNEPIKVSSTSKLKECTVSFDSDIKTGPELKLQVLNTIADQVFNIRMFGSSARQLTYLAEGKLDGIVEFNDHTWDFAAGACIIEEAGGKITNLQGDILMPQHNGFIASNGLIHQEIRETVGKYL